MKKIRVIIFSVIFTVITFLLVSCGDELPESKYEKVEFAFNGVEKSFKNIKLTSNEENTKNGISFDSNVIGLMAAKVNESEYSQIESLYLPSDSQGDKIDDLEYDEPPMIQFQYLKNALEKIGDNFEFGTKYYYDVQNSIYYDVATGKIINDDNYKWNYVFRLALEINIDDNDLITADVSFDIKLTQNNTVYNMNWYVGMELDYDMNDMTPNYTLNMMTDDKGLKGTYVLENDYVNVVDNKINEWRKFNIEADRKVEKDNNHPNFDSYISEGIEYGVDHCKWYKNNNLRKLMNNKGENKRIVANACFNAGLNSTDINGQAFLNKNGISNDKVGEFYTEISDIFGKDIIYSILPDDDDHKNDNDDGSGNDGGSGNDVSGIAIKLDNNTDFGDGNFIVKNVKMSELLTDQQAWKKYDKSTFITPKVYAVDSNNIAGDIFTDINYLDYYFVINNQENSVDKDEYIVNAYKRLNNPDSFTIKVKLGDFSCTFGNSVRIDPDILNSGSSTSDMNELVEAGFPAFVGGNITINKNDNNDFTITGSTENERSVYYDTLKSNEFFRSDSQGDYFVKEAGEKILTVRCNWDNDILAFNTIDENPYEEWNSNKTSEFLDGISIPDVTGAKIHIEYRENQDNTKEIRIWNIPFSEVEEYLESIANNNPDCCFDDGENGFKLRVPDNTNNTYHEVKFVPVENDGFIIYCRTYELLKSKITIDGTDYPVNIDYSENEIKYHFDTPYLPINAVITFTPINFDVTSVLSNSTSDIATFSGLTITPTCYSYYKYEITYSDYNDDIYPYSSYNSDEKAIYLGFIPGESISSNQLSLVRIDGNNPNNYINLREFQYDSQEQAFILYNVNLEVGYNLKISNKKGNDENYTFNVEWITNGIVTKAGTYNFIIYANNPNVVVFYNNNYYYYGGAFGNAQYQLVLRDYIDQNHYVDTTVGTFSYEDNKLIVEANLTAGSEVLIFDQKVNAVSSSFTFDVEGITNGHVTEAGAYKLMIHILNPYVVVEYVQE